VRDAVEVFEDIDIQDPPQPFRRERGAQRMQRVMNTRTWPESVRARQEVLVVDRLQQQRSLAAPLCPRRLESQAAAAHPVLAGLSIGLLHPFHVDDVLQRGERAVAVRPRHVGYPLPFRERLVGHSVPSRVPVNGSLA